MGVVTSASDTTDTSTSEPTDTTPTSMASEGTNSVTTDTTGVTTDSTGETTDSTGSTGETSGSTGETSDSTGVTTGTTGTDSLPAPCAGGDQFIHEDFTDINLRCAVDQAIEKIENPDCMFTCAAAQALTELDASGKAVADTTGIRHLVNLTSLRLSDNEITAIEDLHTLTKLTKLFLYNCEITSAAGLDAVTELQELYLYSNNIDSAAVLPAFQKLTILALGSNKLTSLDGFPVLPTLGRLELGSNQDLSSSSLKILETQTPALMQLYLDDINLTSPGDVPHLDNLEVLNIGENGLLSLAGLYAFQKLEDLQLYGNSLTTVSELDSVSLVLDVLDISDNSLTSEGLLNLSKQLWLDSGDMVYVGGNDFPCGQPFDDALANFMTANVSLNPDPLTCI